MNISTFITKINNSFKICKKKNQPTLEEFINRGFAPKDDKIDILFINPPSTISERYGKDDMGEVGGDLIPLGMASLAAYIREKGFGVIEIDPYDYFPIRWNSFFLKLIRKLFRWLMIKDYNQTISGLCSYKAKH